MLPGISLPGISLPYPEIGPESLATPQICKLARKGSTPSQIGVVLRDSNGIPQVTSITGSKILRILKGKG